MSNQAITVHGQQQGGLTDAQWQMVTDTYMKGATAEEVQIFRMVAERAGLDPWKKQIHAVKRWDSKEGRNVWTFQTGIDGYTAIAHRSGLCAGIDDATFDPADESTPNPKKATVTVWRMVKGERRPFTASARWSEYAQTGRDKKTGDEYLTGLWKKMPYGQLAKCYDTETEVLTNHGFKLFSDVGIDDSIAYVSEGMDEILFCNASPFFYPYDGQMVSYESDMLDFVVTPNHDMITNLGKMEARALHALASSKSIVTLPIGINAYRNGDIQDSDYFKLLGYILADGTTTASNKWMVKVGRRYKVAELDRMNMHLNKRLTHSKGGEYKIGPYTGKTNFDMFTYHFPVMPDLEKDRTLTDSFIRNCTPEQARLVIDAWQFFDGHTNKKTGVRRIYATCQKRVSQIEVLAAKSGYSISGRTERLNPGVSEKPNIMMTITDSRHICVKKWANPPRGNPTVKEKNYSGLVWCVTVPSGMIIVRRNGFSMVCGNCATALALRKAFPEELGGVYTDVEMDQADNDAPPPETKPAPKTGSAPEFKKERNVTPEEPPTEQEPAPSAKTDQAEEVASLLENDSWRDVIVPDGFGISSGMVFGDVKRQARDEIRMKATGEFRAVADASIIAEIQFLCAGMKMQPPAAVPAMANMDPFKLLKLLDGVRKQYRETTDQKKETEATTTEPK